MKRAAMSEEHLAEVDFGRTVLLLGARTPGRTDCTTLDETQLRILHAALTRKVPVINQYGVVTDYIPAPATDGGDGLRLLAAWCLAAADWLGAQG